VKSSVRVIVLVSALAGLTTAAQAQEQPNPSEGARFQWGALRFTPGISVSNVGVDNNVFNDPDHQVSDTTTALGPAVDVWVNAGRLRVTGKSGAQYLYFKNYESQRSWNTADELKFELPLSRLKPFAGGAYVNTRLRPGFEID